jgi:ArsR family transcriptional regulator
MEDRKLIQVLKALADATRFRMVQEIAGAGELSCGQIGERFPLSQPTISHHLRILVSAEILTVRSEAQHRFISVNREVVAHALQLLPGRLHGEGEPRKRSPRARAGATR